MAELSKRDVAVFKGVPQRLRIISNNISYGPPPDPDEEVEQRITINAEGRVWFSAYYFGEYGERYQRARTKTFKLPLTTAEQTLTAVATYFSKEYQEVFATDIGTWTLELTNTDGDVYSFKGSLCAAFEIAGVDLSDMIRDTLEMDDLFVFDGNNKPDSIDRVTVAYHRISKFKPKELPSGAQWEYVIWDYTENLVIDRKADTIEHIQNIGTGCKVSRKYEVEGGVDSLLEEFDADVFFSYTAGNPDDVVDTPLEKKDYQITVEFKKSPARVLTGTFDKNGLPEDFQEFIESVFEFIQFYGTGEIFDSAIYGQVKRRNGDYIFCSVVFDEGYKTYYYISDDDDVAVGDFVVVPVGSDNRNVVVEVVSVDFFNEETAPFPVDKAKHIIRKCSEDDLEPPLG